MEKIRHILISGRSGGNNRFDDSNGFTLIELLIAMAIFAIISIIIATMFDSFQRGYTEQQVTSDVIQKARSALAFMSSDIKVAGLDPIESDNFKVITADATTFTYDFDTPNAAGVFNGTRDVSTTTPERRTYRFLNGRLEQVDNLALVPSPSVETLVPQIDAANSRFEYLNSDRAPIAVPITGDTLMDIAYVRVVLTVVQSAGRSGNISRSMDSLVLCRNLQFNAQR